MSTQSQFLTMINQSLQFKIAALAIVLSFVLNLAKVHAEEPHATDLLGQFQVTDKWKLVSAVELSDETKSFKSTVCEDDECNILLNGDAFDRSLPYLSTNDEFGDVSLRMEFTVPKDSNSGVYFMGRYEVQIYDSFGKEKVDFTDLGGIYQRWHDDNSIAKEERGYEGISPKQNAAKEPGHWQKLEVVFRAPRFNETGEKTENARFVSVKINGETVHENVEVTGPTRAHPRNGEAAEGPIAIQGDHGPIAIRGFKVKRLSL